MLALATAMASLVSCGGNNNPPDTPPDGETPDDPPAAEIPDPLEEDKTLLDDPTFDYLSSDLSKYISLPTEKYKDVALTVNTARPREIDVDVAILKALYSERSKEAGEYYEYPKGVEITAGDEVSIYYRGYLLDGDGNEVFSPNMCNYTSASPSTLGIGSGQFVPGFELGLVGKDPADFGTLTKVTDGTPTEDSCVYISYKRTSDGSVETVSTYRVDMSADVDSLLGEGAYAMLLGSKVGDRIENFETAVDGKPCTYSYITLQLVTYEPSPITVEVYFPYSYSVESLRNVTAYFDVYVTGVRVYDTPEYNDAYVEKILSGEDPPVTRETLEACEGATLAEKYRAYAWEALNTAYESTKRRETETAIWQYLTAEGTAEILAYPKAPVKQYYDGYLEDLKEEYNASSGLVYDQYTGSYRNCKSFEEYCKVYIGTSAWREYLLDLSKSIVKERLILHTILRAEGLTLTEEEHAAAVDAMRESYLDDYIEKYLDREGKSREDYTDEEYEKLLEDSRALIDDYYGDSFFEETVYYEHGMKTIIGYFRVSTLDK